MSQYRMARSCVIAFLLAVPVVAPAQTDGLAIRAMRRDTITAATAVTAVFAVSSQRVGSVEVMPHVEMPEGWTLLLGGAPFDVVAGQLNMLVLSLGVPTRVAAGAYIVRVRLTAKNDVNGTMDSVFVVVPVRKSIDIVLTDRPSYSVSGSIYEVGVQIRNRGNTTSRLRVDVRSSLGNASNADAAFELEPEEVRELRVRVRTPEGLSEATDDLLEVTGRVADDTLRAFASSRVTVVPEPTRNIEAYQRVPVQVNLRAASATGVSPFEAFGGGPVINGRPARLDFLVRGATGKYSSFGEREEYRVELSSKAWRVRAGDHLFRLSPLNGSAQLGVGVGADGHRGPLSFGAFSQQFRRQPEMGNETGAFVSVSPATGARVSLNALNHSGGSQPGVVGSASAELTRPSFHADAEVARSRNGASSGSARALRVAGRSTLVSWDVGHLFADTAFTGSQRGAEHDYITAHASPWKNLSLNLNASTNRANLARVAGVPNTERFDVGGVNATLFNRMSLDLGGAERSTRSAGATQTGRQQSLRARGDQSVVFGSLTLEGELGQATQPLLAPRTYTDYSLAARRPLRNGSLSASVSRYSGGAITKGADPSLSVGGDLTRRFGAATDVSLMGTATRLEAVVFEWHTQITAQVSHRLASGNSLRLRARVLANGVVPDANQSVAYLEYSMPVRVPVSRLRTSGRVYGRVVDGESGHGVANALVRLGPQMAITDKLGRVWFGGVPGGEHRVSMSQETSFADAVFVGDPRISVDSLRTQPTTFTFAIVRSARVNVVVRRFSVSRTGLGGKPDSLTESGAVANATLVLANPRDTLYRISNEDGEALFTDVPPGEWILSVWDDAPAFHRYEPDRMELTLAPGQAQRVAFRLIPRRRDVQLMVDEKELRPDTADPKSRRAPASVVRKPTVKPPTVTPPTVKPSTVKPPTVKPTTVKPPTIKPPTVKPPTVKPPTGPAPTAQPPTVWLVPLLLRTSRTWDNAPADQS